MSKKINEEVTMSITANGAEDIAGLMRTLAGIGGASEINAGPQIEPVAVAAPARSMSDIIGSLDHGDEEAIDVPGVDDEMNAFPGDDSSEIDEAERNINYANTPDEVTAPLASSFPKGNGGDFQRSRVAMTPNGNNPLAEDELEEGVKSPLRGKSLYNAGQKAIKNMSADAKAKKEEAAKKADQDAKAKKVDENVRITRDTIEDKLYGQFKSIMSTVQEAKAVVKTKGGEDDIGVRICDVGPGGKESNVKTDKKWDEKKGKEPVKEDNLANREGPNRIGKRPRVGQSDMSNIPVGNLPGSKRPYSDADRSARPGQIKNLIKKTSHPAPGHMGIAEGPDSSRVVVSGRPVNTRSIELGGIDYRNPNDLSNVYVEKAMFDDGQPLSDYELEELRNTYGELLSNLLHDHITGLGESRMTRGLNEATMRELTLKYKKQGLTTQQAIEKAKKEFEKTKTTAMAEGKEGYQKWPGEKKKSFYNGPKDADGKTETQKWAEKKKAEREADKDEGCVREAYENEYPENGDIVTFNTPDGKSVTGILKIVNDELGLEPTFKIKTKSGKVYKLTSYHDLEMDSLKKVGAIHGLREADNDEVDESLDFKGVSNMAKKGLQTVGKKIQGVMDKGDAKMRGVGSTEVTASSPRVPSLRTGTSKGTPTVVEGADLAALRAKKKEIDDKIDAIITDGGRVDLQDPLTAQLKKVCAQIKKAKAGIKESLLDQYNGQNAGESEEAANERNARVIGHPKYSRYFKQVPEWLHPYMARLMRQGYEPYEALTLAKRAESLNESVNVTEDEDFEPLIVKSKHYTFKITYNKRTGKYQVRTNHTVARHNETLATGTLEQCKKYCQQREDSYTGHYPDAIKESVNVTEDAASGFNNAMKKAQAAIERGDTKRAKYHHGTAGSYMYAIPSNKASQCDVEGWRKMKQDLHGQSEQVSEADSSGIPISKLIRNSLPAGAWEVGTSKVFQDTSYTKQFKKTRYAVKFLNHMNNQQQAEVKSTLLNSGSSIYEVIVFKDEVLVYCKVPATITLGQSEQVSEAKGGAGYAKMFKGKSPEEVAKMKQDAKGRIAKEKETGESPFDRAKKKTKPTNESKNIAIMVETKSGKVGKKIFESMIEMMDWMTEHKANIAGIKHLKG